MRIGKGLKAWWACRLMVAAVVCMGAGCMAASSSSASPAAPAASASWPSLASQGFREFIGTGDGSQVAWHYSSGLWGGQNGSSWWQSALGIALLARYGQLTRQLRTPIQTVLVRTYQANVSKADRNFTDKFMDDTAWWGLAWLAAARYELYFGDQRDARRFLTVAETDASYIAQQPKVCGGISWTTGGAPHTISQATFIALAAELARFLHSTGPLHDARRAAAWLSEAEGAWAWLAQSGLVDVSTGEVAKDSMSDGSCGQLQGGPVTYTQGEVADALVQLGSALGNPSYDYEAAGFLLYAIKTASPFVFDGVLQDRCETISTNCSANPLQQDVMAFKGIFIQGVSDWASATLSAQFNAFLQAQPTAVLNNDVLGASTPSAPCDSPHSCQFGMSWARQVSPMLVSAGTQESALVALTAGISATLTPKIDLER